MKFNMYENYVKIEMESKSQNEAFARVTAACFVTPLDPTLEEISDIKTAVSEAVTNSIIHGYDGKDGKIIMELTLKDKLLCVEITDFGVGIEDIELAMQPMYTTKSEFERSGMGFSFMEAFMDELEVESDSKNGTKIKMKKLLGKTDYDFKEEND